jgi:hypothetical protein
MFTRTPQPELAELELVTEHICLTVHKDNVYVILGLSVDPWLCYSLPNIAP